MDKILQTIIKMDKSARGVKTQRKNLAISEGPSTRAIKVNTINTEPEAQIENPRKA